MSSKRSGISKRRREPQRRTMEISAKDSADRSSTLGRDKRSRQEEDDRQHELPDTDECGQVVWKQSTAESGRLSDRVVWAVRTKDDCRRSPRHRGQARDWIDTTALGSPRCSPATLVGYTSAVSSVVVVCWRRKGRKRRRRRGTTKDKATWNKSHLFITVRQHSTGTGSGRSWTKCEIDQSTKVLLWPYVTASDAITKNGSSGCSDCAKCSLRPTNERSHISTNQNLAWPRNQSVSKCKDRPNRNLCLMLISGHARFVYLPKARDAEMIITKHDWSRSMSAVRNLKLRSVVQTGISAWNTRNGQQKGLHLLKQVFLPSARLRNRCQSSEDGSWNNCALFSNALYLQPERKK